MNDRLTLAREHGLFKLVRDLWEVRGVLGRIAFVSGGEGFALCEAYEITDALRPSLISIPMFVGESRPRDPAQNFAATFRIEGPFS
jgi:alkyl sulfatase BDS1-like metallo-beta-lactamase superfamily hydrolase